MTQPGTPGSQIPAHDLDALARRLRDTERRLSQLESNAIGPNGYVIGDRASIRTIDFDGTSFADPGTAGVYLASEAGVGRLIVNEIYLRDGIVGNDALANPLTTIAQGQSLQPAAFTTTLTTLVSVTIAVPAGFTRVTLVSSVIVGGLNPTGGADNLISQINVSGAFSGSSYAAPQGVAAGYSTMNNQTYNGTWTGLTGGATFTVAGKASTTVAGWASSPLNFVTLNALAIFTR